MFESAALLHVHAFHWLFNHAFSVGYNK